MQDDPLAVIETDTPKFTADQAVSMVRKHYEIDVTVEELVSERDQNFRLSLSDGRQFVLKIANALEDPQVTDFQIKALLHLQDWIDKNNSPISAPQILPTIDHEAHFSVSAAGASHIARVVSFVSGVPVGNRIPSAELSERMGAYLAHLGRALKSFHHSGHSQVLLWDMQRALSLRELLPHIDDGRIRGDVETTLSEFENSAFPAFPTLRKQVIHSDFNPDNVLTNASGTDVAGVIDFGDMLQSPLVTDVAIGAAYLIPETGDPLSLIAEFVRGYHAVTALTQTELEMLYVLVKTRVATTVSIGHWRLASKGKDDPYLQKYFAADSSADSFLLQLSEIPVAHATRVFKQVCASTEQVNG